MGFVKTGAGKNWQGVARQKGRKQGEERKEKEEEGKEKKEKKREEKEEERKEKKEEKGKKKKKQEKERNKKKEIKQKNIKFEPLTFFMVWYAIQLSFQDGMPREARTCRLGKKVV